MKRSVAMMACVLSGALMISAYSPVVFAETDRDSATVTDSKYQMKQRMQC